MQVRLEEAEGRISHLEDTTERLVSNQEHDDKRMKALWDRIQMHENHSKRNNVRLLGMKETYGTNGTIEGCMKQILSVGLEVDFEGEFKIEQAHQALAPSPNENQPPRPVLKIPATVGERESSESCQRKTSARVGRSEALRISRYVEGTGREEENIHICELHTTAAKREIHTCSPGNTAI